MFPTVEGSLLLVHIHDSHPVSLPLMFAAPSYVWPRRSDNDKLSVISMSLIQLAIVAHEVSLGSQRPTKSSCGMYSLSIYRKHIDSCSLRLMSCVLSTITASCFASATLDDLTTEFANNCKISFCTKGLVNATLRSSQWNMLGLSLQHSRSSCCKFPLVLSWHRKARPFYAF